MIPDYIHKFLLESNAIEGIHRLPTPAELVNTRNFFDLSQVSVPDLCNLANIYAPGHVLRNRPGFDVRVGNHIAPIGSPEISEWLSTLCTNANSGRDPWLVHCEYQFLHPFTDGNGRSGRALWAWQMLHQHNGFPLGFLHHFYYQTLRH